MNHRVHLNSVAGAYGCESCGLHIFEPWHSTEYGRVARLTQFGEAHAEIMEAEVAA